MWAAASLTAARTVTARCCRRRSPRASRRRRWKSPERTYSAPVALYGCWRSRGREEKDGAGSRAHPSCQQGHSIVPWPPFSSRTPSSSTEGSREDVQRIRRAVLGDGGRGEAGEMRGGQLCPPIQPTRPQRVAVAVVFVARAVVVRRGVQEGRRALDLRSPMRWWWLEVGSKEAGCAASSASYGEGSRKAGERIDCALLDGG